MHQKDKRKVVGTRAEKRSQNESWQWSWSSAPPNHLHFTHTQIRDRKTFICVETSRQGESWEKGEWGEQREEDWEDNWRFMDLGHILMHSHILVSCITYVFVLESFFRSSLFQVTPHNVKHSSRGLLAMSSGYCDEWVDAMLAGLPCLFLWR